jgi:ABC-type transport system involved in cytochrome bd biosynthesis fused ATPase/permease subunit
MILSVTQTLLSIPIESMGMIEFVGMVSIGMTAGSLGLL